MAREEAELQSTSGLEAFPDESKPWHDAARLTEYNPRGTACRVSFGEREGHGRGRGV